ncbi:hypothetical protein G7Y89_g14538 [Cudoniella acicularis]|uniref:Store-operated calcium entry-associated regulatory factor n=1 Tax=Cudoniella acicularis TaxID=354080 RepID=A0A8H4R292_9HELO|nr:hypothetical protein G7Y89_g14538 [Cudoniella acicularis]
MQLLSFLYPALLALLLTPDSALSAKPPKNAILLSKVKSITLRANAKTSHRRVPAVDQLTCEGPGCRHYKVDVMRCTNAGSDYNEEDIQWTCTADVPEEFKLGSTDVQCEGYASRDDPYVLKGSCGVKYRLLLTDKGEEKYGSGGFWGGGNKASNGGEEGWTFAGAVFTFVFLGFVGLIIYAIWRAIQEEGRRPPGARPGGYGGGGWGGGGGGGGGYPYDPPPPYPGKRYNQSSEGWRPGFWSGALGGAAAGYAAGSRRQRQPEPASRSSWFGGGDSGGSPRGHTPRSTSSSSNTYESTGFGSTSRR